MWSSNNKTQINHVYMWNRFCSRRENRMCVLVLGDIRVARIPRSVVNNKNLDVIFLWVEEMTSVDRLSL